MKIACLLGPISENAVEPTFERFFTYFKSHKFDLIICGNFDNRVMDYIKSQKKDINIEFLGQGIPNLLFHSPRLILKARSYDLLFTYGGHIPYGFLMYIISKILKKRFICRVNSYPSNRKTLKINIKRKLEHHLLTKGDIIIFNSKNQMKDILSRNNIDFRPNYHVIAPGINFKRFYKASPREVEILRAKYSLKRDEHILGVCITPRPGKGINILIEAAEILHKKGRKFKVVIIGTSRYNSKYKEFINEKDLTNNFIWVGHQPNHQLYKWYSLFDITVLPSWGESFGMSISESYMCETPCVASNVGGINDQIIHNVTGFLVEPGNARKLSEYIDKMIINPELRRLFAKRGKEYVKDKFDLNTVGEKYKELFDAINDKL